MVDTPFDPLNPVHWLAGLQHLPFTVALDSCQPGAPFGKFSVVAALPARYFVAHHAQALEEWVRQPDGTYHCTRTHRGSVAATLANLQSQVEPTDESLFDKSGFCGGLIGFLSYELGQLMQGVAIADPRRQTIAEVFESPLAWVGDFDHAVVLDHETQQTYFLGMAQQWQPQPLTVPLALLAKPGHRTMNTSLSASQYQARMARLKDYIAAGDCYQVNLTRQFDAPWPHAALTTYAHLRAATPMPFAAYVDLGDSQLLSLSPERFLHIAQGVMETKPIKGTRPRSADPKIDQALRDALLHSTKDRAENVMIVDLLRNDLGRSAVPGSVQVPKLFDLESFANVHQLVSTVTAKLQPEQSPLGALLQAFPGGSITGAPKRRAMEIIAELEPHRRGPYCGSIFYQSANGTLDSNIMIRTLGLQNGHLWAWAGGGIVWDSDATAEFEETHDKIRHLVEALGLTLP